MRLFCLILELKGVEISSAMVKQFEKLLVGGIWCILDIEYFYEEGQNNSPFIITELKPIQMPNLDLEAVFEGRKGFSDEEWLDVLFTVNWY